MTAQVEIEQCSRCGRPESPTCCAEPPAQREVTAETTRGGEARDAYAKSVAMNRLISAGRVALKEKKARRGDSRSDCRARIAAAINARAKAGAK